MRKSKVDLRAANNVNIDVRFKMTSRVYIVWNVDEVYLSLDVLVGLRIMNKFFSGSGRGEPTRMHPLCSSGHLIAILEDFRDKERWVDDTIFWDSNLEKHWWRTIKFLETVGKSGIVLNPEKFQFCATKRTNTMPRPARGTAQGQSQNNCRTHHAA